MHLDMSPNTHPTNTTAIEVLGNVITIIVIIINAKLWGNYNDNTHEYLNYRDARVQFWYYIDITFRNGCNFEEDEQTGIIGLISSLVFVYR